MKKLADLQGIPLEWIQPKAFTRSYELRGGKDLIGTLNWVKALGSLAASECADAAWTFKRAGFLHPRVTVRPQGQDVDIVKVDMGWGGKGTLRLEDGLAVPFVGTNFWKSEWAFLGPDNRPIVTFRMKPRFLRRAAIVSVDDSAWRTPHLALMLMLGWYLIVLQADDAAAAGVAAGG